MNTRLQAAIQNEAHLLGCLMLDSKAIDNVPDLRADDFSEPQLADIYRLIRAESNASRQYDVLAIAGKLDQINSNLTLQDLTDMVTGCYLNNVANYAKSIQKEAQRRAIQNACYAALGDINAGRDPEEILNSISANLMEGERVERKGARSLQQILSDHTSLMEARLDGKVKRVSTGLSGLDAKLHGGFAGGDLVIVAGRPAMGKTAASACMSLGASKSGPVLIINMEMQSEQIADRYVAHEGSVPLDWVLEPKDEAYWDNYTQAVLKLQDTPIWIDDCPEHSLYSIRASAKSVKRKAGGLSMIIVDYLSLMGGSEAKERFNQVAEFSRGLKKLAKELDVPIVALAQLSRKVEERADKRPIMSDLRESGQIEQDADVIIFLYRDEVYNPDTQDKGIAELIIGKNRQGSTGTVPAVFKGQFTRFENYEQQWIPAPVAAPTKSRGGFHL